MQNPNVVNPNSPANASGIFSQDLNPGQDYAIQVQEVKANFKGQLTENIRWTVDVFDMEKNGVRQANAPSQCYVIHNGIQAPFLPTPYGPNPAEHQCHDLSQAQTINWSTTELTPKLEGTWGALTVEYSHPIRIFEANDSTVTRDYDGSSASSLPLSQPYNVPPDSGSHSIQWPYAVVDNNITNIDQVKISLNPDGDNKFYALMLNGETFNETVGTNAFFNNVDVRWTNNSIENLTLVTHWKQFNEVETLPNFALTPAEDFSNPAGVPWTNQDTGQHTEDVGTSALWRPFGRGFGLGGLAITGSYDYQILHRDDAVYSTPATLPTVGPPPTPGIEESLIDQTYTITNTFEIRPTVRWSPTFDTYFKYRLTLVDQPLIGVKPINGTYNTLLPQADNLEEFGGTWLPTKELVCNATLGIEQAYTNIPNPAARRPSPPINFTENSYPYSVSLAYTPTAKWTFTGGYANYTDFISQFITLGDDYFEPRCNNQPHASPPGPLGLSGLCRSLRPGHHLPLEQRREAHRRRPVDARHRHHPAFGRLPGTFPHRRHRVQQLQFDEPSRLLAGDRRHGAGAGGDRLARPRAPGHVLPLPVLQFQRPDPALRHRHRQRVLGRLQLGPLKLRDGRLFTTPR